MATEYVLMVGVEYEPFYPMAVFTVKEHAETYIRHRWPDAEPLRHDDDNGWWWTVTYPAKGEQLRLCAVALNPSVPRWRLLYGMVHREDCGQLLAHKGQFDSYLFSAERERVLGAMKVFGFYSCGICFTSGHG